MQFGKISFALFAIVASSAVAANPVKVHTWHTIRVSEGTWHAKLQMINEEGAFVNRDGAAFSHFNVNACNPQDFGFSITANDDFNVAYTLTLVKQENNHFTSKACVYVVTATGPGVADVRPTSFNGAKCEITRTPGRSFDFSIS